MDTTLITNMARQQNDAIEKTVIRERGRLLSFIRKRVANEEEAEDILQDVFFQFVEAYRAIESIERVTSWLFSVARNKIIDRYRKKKPEPLRRNIAQRDPDEETLMLEDILPDLTHHQDDELMRSVIVNAIAEALDELPEAQRQVFVWHQFEDKSFKEISALTGETVNTLLSRKRYAILHLRERLQTLYNEL
jgi:RNA polymerase sigma factor (sigma-70 family)